MEAASNTIDINPATITFPGGKSGATPNSAGITLDLTQDDGQVQYVYDQALSNTEELGNLYGANALSYDVTDGISLNGYFPDGACRQRRHADHGAEFLQCHDRHYSRRHVVGAGRQQ